MRSSGSSAPKRASSPSAASGAAGDGFRGAPLIWGMELLRLRRSLLFTRAISRPTVRVVFRLARGVRARRLGPQFCQLTYWSPLSQSPPSQRAFSPRARTRGPAWIPLRGAFCFEALARQSASSRKNSRRFFGIKPRESKGIESLLRFDGAQPRKDERQGRRRRPARSEGQRDSRGDFRVSALA